MTSAKQAKLEETYNTLLAIVFHDHPLDQAKEIVSRDVMGYGTTIDERILDFSGFIKLIQDQRDQSVGIEAKFQVAPVLRRLMPGGDAAIFVDETKITMNIDGAITEFTLRISFIFEFIERKWKLTHWHGSRAIEITGDTWHKEEWKQKNNELQKKVDEKTAELQTSIANLKSTQSQLIQSEKMASLGELTAGIAHEIQNPLNFVNNFSEVNAELIDEMKSELATGNQQQAAIIADDVKQNLEKILHHGKRADAIVKGMLQHSRSSSGVKELTDINALCDEYLRLAYHGIRAKDKSFNATMKTDFDPTILKIKIIPQDIGRVVLNLLTNAFYAVGEKKKPASKDYEPTVTVSSKKIGTKVEIRVTDNGNGIPQKVLDKIFQPFFTTKPTGQGTGLGLSLSYDIVTKGHGGELKVETMEGQGSEFIIVLPS